MDNFECKVCKYLTKYKKDYAKHTITKKHIQKVALTANDKFTDHSLNSDNLNAPQCTPNALKFTKNIQKNICDYCNSSFTRSNSLMRHKNVCLKKKDEELKLKNLVKELNSQLELSRTENKYYINEMDHYKEETNYYKQMLREAGGLVKKSVSSLTYIVDHYENAPALQTITMGDIKILENDEKKFIEDIISAFKHKTLGKYLGSLIIKLYKKDDPKSQSIWNTDDSRLTYLIKELLNNKSSNWIIDKKGVKTTEYLIDPLLLHIKKLLISYQKNLIIPDLNQNSVEVEFILESSKKIIELTNDIDDGLISKEVLRYISCHLRFDGKLIKKALE